MTHTPIDMLPLAAPGPLPEVIAEHMAEIREAIRDNRKLLYAA